MRLFRDKFVVPEMIAEQIKHRKYFAIIMSPKKRGIEIFPLLGDSLVYVHIVAEGYTELASEILNIFTDTFKPLTMISEMLDDGSSVWDIYFDYEEVGSEVMELKSKFMLKNVKKIEVSRISYTRVV